jgi:hypothetical protein
MAKQVVNNPTEGEMFCFLISSGWNRCLGPASDFVVEIWPQLIINRLHKILDEAVAKAAWLCLAPLPGAHYIAFGIGELEVQILQLTFFYSIEAQPVRQRRTDSQRSTRFQLLVAWH